MEIQQVKLKTDIDISKEWDDLAISRFNQLSSKKDLSFQYILYPAIEKLISKSNLTNVLDVGCGTGNLTNLLSCKVDNIDGVDFSSKSIELANKHFGKQKNISFYHSSIENYAEENEGLKYTLAIANMTLMDAPNLQLVLSSIRALLTKQSHFIFTITHPCYWPFYWKYYDEKWFKYNKEIYIEAEFKISLESNKKIATHIHRPLEMYINTLKDAGFTIEEIVEPMPSTEVEKQYPEPWNYPRFIGMKCSISN